jgi:fibronectin-binding autotransporter adhesin
MILLVFGKGANFKQLVKLLAADVEASLGAKIRIKDGHLGGKLECRDAAPIEVMGGNIDVMDADVTGKGSINVMQGGQVNVMGGDIHVRQGGNIVIGDSGKLVMMGGQVIYVSSSAAPIALEYPILATLGGTNQTTYATGDTLFASAADTLAKLPIGTSGDVLTVNGSGVPMWTSIPSGPGGTVTSVTAGSGLDVGAGPGGSITAAGTLNIAPLGVTNAMLAGTITNAKLQNSSLTVTAGSGLSGGGAVSLGGTTTLSIPASSVTNAMLAGGITNANLQNSTVTVSPGSGLSGGGSVSLGGTTTLSLSTTPSVTNLTITGPVNNSMFAATKQYVDAAVSALNVHEPVL